MIIFLLKTRSTRSTVIDSRQEMEVTLKWYQLPLVRWCTLTFPAAPTTDLLRYSRSDRIISIFTSSRVSSDLLSSSVFTSFTCPPSSRQYRLSVTARRYTYRHGRDFVGIGGGRATAAAATAARRRRSGRLDQKRLQNVREKSRSSQGFEHDRAQG